MYDRDGAVSTRPEAELLLCCARTCMDSERAERIRTLLRADIDWAYLLETAPQHGMVPLLYWSLNNTCPEAVPRAILDQLRDDFHNNARRNLFLTGELLKLLNLFEAHEIRGIPFKGPVLAFSVYGNLALRQFSDLDILVRERDILKAKELLLSQGYRPNCHPIGAQKAVHLQSQHHIDLMRDDDKVIVELHWRFTSRKLPFPLDPGRLWERLETASLAGMTVFNLPPEDLLLVLCVHGTEHRWERLGWICDIAELIGVYQEMDWGRVIEQASVLRIERTLLLGLLLANSLLDTALPERVLQRIQADPAVKWLAVQRRERLFREADGPLAPFEELLYFRIYFQIKVREHLLDRVRFCLDFACFTVTPNEKDWAILPLPVSLSFLYYLLRPIRLVGKYGLSPLQRLLKHLLIR
jgi:hypothetical protein